MAIIKLNPGEKVLLTIRKADVVEGNYGPQYKFAGSTPNDPDAVLFLNIDTAERQLARAGFASVAAALDGTVEIEKVERDGKKFTNINRPSGSVAAPRAAQVKAPHTSGPYIEGIDGPRPIVTPEYGDVEGQRSALAALQVGKLNGVLNLHDVCVDHAISVTVKKLGAANIPVTAGDVLAAAATMMIGAQKVGAAA